MEHTFLQPHVRIEKREGEHSLSDAVGQSGGTEAHGGAPTQIGAIAFQPQEMVALSNLDLDTETVAPGAVSFRLQIGETPAEFMRVFSSLERIVSRVGDVSTVTIDLREAEWPYILGVTSAIRGEGKTTMALHLAMTIARSTPKRVCLIDLSLGGSDLATRLGMPPGDGGLVASMEEDIDVVPCFNMTGLDNLMIVPAGRPPANPARFARLPRVAQFLVAARHAFDVIVVDMPAVATENAAPLTRHMDGVVMVVRAGVTPRDVVAEAMETVGTDRLSCVLLNRAKPSAPKWLQKRFGRS